MANQRVSIEWRCKTDKGWRRFPVLTSANGRIRKGVVRIDGEERTYPNGFFQLRWQEGKRSVYKSVGTDGSEAVTAQRQQQAALQLQTQAAVLGAELKLPDDQKTLRTLRDEFMAKKKLVGISKNGVSGYNTMFDGFFATCRKVFPSEIVKDDVLRYRQALLRDEYAEHTIFNRNRRLISFLKFCGVNAIALPMAAGERLKKPKQEVEMYHDREWGALAAHLTDAIRDAKTDRDRHLLERDLLAFEFLWKTGTREREMAFMEWPNFDFRHDIVKIVNKPHLGFRVKDGDARDIPLDPQLKARLQEWKEKHGERRFPFGTFSDSVEGHFLRRLKIAARDAKLNCGLCQTCATNNECERWYLHKFRSTFATTVLRGNIDVRTLQEWMGHSSLEPTLVYLKALESTEAHTRMGHVFSAFGSGDKIVTMPKRRAG